MRARLSRLLLYNLFDISILLSCIDLFLRHPPFWYDLVLPWPRNRSDSISLLFCKVLDFTLREAYDLPFRLNTMYWQVVAIYSKCIILAKSHIYHIPDGYSVKVIC